MHMLALAGTVPVAPSDALVAALLPPVTRSPALLMALGLAVLSSVVFSVLASSRAAFGRRRGPFVGAAIGVLGAVLFFFAVRWEERARAWTRARVITTALESAGSRVQVVRPGEADGDGEVVVVASYGSIAAADGEVVRLSWREAQRVADALGVDVPRSAGGGVSMSVRLAH